MYVEVWGQPWVSVLNFYLVWDRVSYYLRDCYIYQASWPWDSRFKSAWLNNGCGDLNSDSHDCIASASTQWSISLAWKTQLLSEFHFLTYLVPLEPKQFKNCLSLLSSISFWLTCKSGPHAWTEITEPSPQPDRRP